MAIVNEIAQLTQDLNRRVLDEIPSGKVYEQWYSLWQESCTSCLLESMESALNHYVKIESLAVEGKISEAQDEFLEMVRQLLKELTPEQQKSITDNDIRSRSRANGSSPVSGRQVEKDWQVPSGTSIIGAFVRKANGRLIARTSQDWLPCYVDDDTVLERTYYSVVKQQLAKPDVDYRGYTIDRVVAIPKEHRFRGVWERIRIGKRPARLVKVVK